MEFQKLVNRALDLQRQYAEKEKELYGSPSTGERLAEGFLGDARNLQRMIAALPDRAPTAGGEEKVAALLAHCLWSVIVLAGMQGIDLETSFMETMDRLEAHLLETD
jgi:hypothetical protein